MAWRSDEEKDDDNFVVSENRNKPPYCTGFYFGNLGPSALIMVEKLSSIINKFL